MERCLACEAVVSSADDEEHLETGFALVGKNEQNSRHRAPPEIG